MRLCFLRFIVVVSVLAAAAALSNSKIYEDPAKPLAELSDEFKTLSSAAYQSHSHTPASPQRVGINKRRSQLGDSRANAVVCLTPPCETEDIMVHPQVQPVDNFSPTLTPPVAGGASGCLASRCLPPGQDRSGGPFYNRKIYNRISASLSFSTVAFTLR